MMYLSDLGRYRLFNSAPPINGKITDASSGERSEISSFSLGVRMKPSPEIYEPTKLVSEFALSRSGCFCSCCASQREASMKLTGFPSRMGLGLLPFET